MIIRVEAIPGGPSAWRVESPAGYLKRFRPGDILVFKPVSVWYPPRKNDLILMEIVFPNRVEFQVWKNLSRNFSRSRKIAPGKDNHVDGHDAKRVIGVLMCRTKSKIQNQSF